MRTGCDQARAWISCSGVVIAIAAAPGVAAAQSAPPAATQIDEVVVTAQRREQAVQDVPISVTALSASDMQRRNVQRSIDFDDQVANVIVEQGFGLSAPRITIRGVTNSDFNLLSNSPVTTYVDEVVLNSVYDLGFSTFDLERIEALRGPQGTLFGRNSTSGALQFFSARPTSQFEGYARVTVGSFGQRRAEAAASGPLGDGLLQARVAGIRNVKDGHVRNLATGGHTPKQDDWAVRLLLEAGEGTPQQALLKVQYGKSTGEPRVYNNILPRNTFLEDVLGVPSPNPGPASRYRVIYSDVEGVEEVERLETWQASLRLRWELDSVTLTSITGASGHERKLISDEDGVAAALLHEYADDEQSQFSQELQISGENGVVDWILGAYYLRERVKGFDAFELSGFVPFLDLSAYGTDRLVGNTYSDQRLKSYALFAHSIIDLAGPWSATVGLRGSRDEKTLQQRFVPCTTYDSATANLTQLDRHVLFVATPRNDPTGVCGAVPGSLAQSGDWDSLSGRLGLEFKPTPSTLAYASYSRGFKGGGFNGGAGSAASASTVDPETIDAYEVGLKLSAFNRRLTVNSALFYYDYRDFQVLSLVRDPAGVGVIQTLTNLPTSRLHGGEIELTAYPTDRLILNLALGWVDTRIGSFTDAAGTVLTGNEIPAAADLNFEGFVSWDAVVEGEWVLNTQFEWSYVGGYYSNLANSSIGRAGDYWDANVRVSLSSGGGVSATVFVENIFDDVQITSHFPALIDSFGTTFSATREPRRYGLTISYDF